MTDEQKEAYLNACNRCPFCEMETVESDAIKFETEITAECSCLTCKKRWRDIYTLTGVEEIDNDN